MIGKHLILEIIDLKTKLTQSEPDGAYVKSLIEKPLQDLSSEREKLVKEFNAIEYPEFPELY